MDDMTQPYAYLEAELAAIEKQAQSAQNQIDNLMLIINVHQQHFTTLKAAIENQKQADAKVEPDPAKPAKTDPDVVKVTSSME